MPYLEVFIFLQMLDFLTTLAGFHLGGREMSPFIRLLMQFGPITGLALAKLGACILAGYCVWSRRRRVIEWTNYGFAAIVIWNMVMIVRALALLPVAQL